MKKTKYKYIPINIYRLTLTVFVGALSLVLLMTAAVGAIYLATFGVGLLGLVGIYLLLDMIQKQIDGLSLEKVIKFYFLQLRWIKKKHKL